MTATRLAGTAATRADGAALVAELRRLLEAHRDVGSETAAALLAGPLPLRDVWLVEPAEPVEASLPGAASPPGGGSASLERVPEREAALVGPAVVQAVAMRQTSTLTGAATSSPPAPLAQT